MAKNKDRYFEALDMKKRQRAKLTPKQYLVYSYLVSISKWNANKAEQHYYTYKNSYVLNDVCKDLGLSANTWRSSIKILEEKGYIEIGRDEKGKEIYYKLFIPYSYVALHIDVIKFLLRQQKRFKCGGHLISVYSLLYKCWEKDSYCEFTLSQVMNTFTKTRTKDTYDDYRQMLSIFKGSGLMDFKVEQRLYKGIEYNCFCVNQMSLTMPTEYYVDGEEPILRQIEDTNREGFEEIIDSE